ncbi:uncharacterized protein BDR25DRAFT_350932 [Lindgomyces ingoldianus]|uniref:Uncharacterized protein n=1 Tax=Lindgomyces ingoldianus TaxID=673940 RepID=A0ACB6R9Y4_9PLEO|nr:uncharacterized protein BDR25DRAFT_350932 [Lindgomyces ingoldianus]KAF2475568.1 hypothetical protein BDR25DRAFT_350932 [Lindgomyces ingoldianus]
MDFLGDKDPTLSLFIARTAKSFLHSECRDLAVKQSHRSPCGPRALITAYYMSEFLHFSSSLVAGTQGRSFLSVHNLQPLSSPNPKLLTSFSILVVTMDRGFDQLHHGTLFGSEHSLQNYPLHNHGDTSPSMPRLPPFDFLERPELDLPAQLQDPQAHRRQNLTGSMKSPAKGHEGPDPVDTDEEWENLHRDSFPFSAYTDYLYGSDARSLSLENEYPAHIVPNQVDMYSQSKATPDSRVWVAPEERWWAQQQLEASMSAAAPFPELSSLQALEHPSFRPPLPEYPTFTPPNMGNQMQIDPSFNPQSQSSQFLKNFRSMVSSQNGNNYANSPASGLQVGHQDPHLQFSCQNNEHQTVRSHIACSNYPTPASCASPYQLPPTPTKQLGCVVLKPTALTNMSWMPEHIKQALAPHMAKAWNVLNNQTASQNEKVNAQRYLVALTHQVLHENRYHTLRQRMPLVWNLLKIRQASLPGSSEHENAMQTLQTFKSNLKPEENMYVQHMIQVMIDAENNGKSVMDTLHIQPPRPWKPPQCINSVDSSSSPPTSSPLLYTPSKPVPGMGTSAMSTLNSFRGNQSEAPAPSQQHPTSPNGYHPEFSPCCRRQHPTTRCNDHGHGHETQESNRIREYRQKQSAYMEQLLLSGNGQESTQNAKWRIPSLGAWLRISVTICFLTSVSRAFVVPMAWLGLWSFLFLGLLLALGQKILIKILDTKCCGNGLSRRYSVIVYLCLPQIIFELRIKTRLWFLPCDVHRYYHSDDMDVISNDTERATSLTYLPHIKMPPSSQDSNCRYQKAPLPPIDRIKMLSSDTVTQANELLSRCRLTLKFAVTPSKLSTAIRKLPQFLRDPTSRAIPLIPVLNWPTSDAIAAALRVFAGGDEEGGEFHAGRGRLCISNIIQDNPTLFISFGNSDSMSRYSQQYFFSRLVIPTPILSYQPEDPYNPEYESFGPKHRKNQHVTPTVISIIWIMIEPDTHSNHIKTLRFSCWLNPSRSLHYRIVPPLAEVGAMLLAPRGPAINPVRKPDVGSIPVGEVRDAPRLDKCHRAKDFITRPDEHLLDFNAVKPLLGKKIRDESRSEMQQIPTRSPSALAGFWFFAESANDAPSKSDLSIRGKPRTASPAYTQTILRFNLLSTKGRKSESKFSCQQRTCATSRASRGCTIMRDQAEVHKSFWPENRKEFSYSWP